MKHLFFLAVILTTAATTRGQEEEGPLSETEGGLHGMLGISWGSEYIWRGFDVFDDKSVLHFMADLDLFDTGFGLSAVGHRSNSSGFEDMERWDYTAYYQNRAFTGEPYATNVRVGWMYYNYPHRNRGESLDLQEGHLLMTWPSILPVKGLQPSYALIKMWPAHSESRLPDSASGWLHIMMLDYGFTIPGIIPDMPALTIRLHSELVFNDGWTPTPEFPNPDQGWSHAAFGASTDFALDRNKNIVFTPAVYYQTTMDRSINEDDGELWSSFSLKYAF